MQFVISHATLNVNEAGTLDVFGFISSHAKLAVDISGPTPVATVIGEADRMSPRIKTALQNAVAEAVASAMKAKSNPRIAGESLERAVIALKPTPRVDSSLAPTTTPEAQDTPVKTPPPEPAIEASPVVEEAQAKPQEATVPIAATPAPAPAA